MLLAFILGPMMEEYLRRALLLSRGDPMVFLQRPISATLLAIGVLAIIAASIPSLYKKREEAFRGIDRGRISTAYCLPVHDRLACC